MDFDEETIETLARSIHEKYCTEIAPHAPPWALLSEDKREANRDQARDIPAKLATIGAHIQPGPQATPFAFTKVELERLARAEHERWLTQRTRAGWTHGQTPDDDKRTHPMLIPWEHLTDRERDKDRSAIRHIPNILARIGVHIERNGPDAGERAKTTV